MADVHCSIMLVRISVAIRWGQKVLVSWPELYSQTAHSVRLVGTAMKPHCEVFKKWLQPWSSKSYSLEKQVLV